MADVTGVDTVETGVQVRTPLHSEGFGPAEQADETRQAQQQLSNDTPADVNLNAVVAREQAATLVLMGKGFEANADRRNKLFDHFAATLISK